MGVMRKRHLGNRVHTVNASAIERLSRRKAVGAVTRTGAEALIQIEVSTPRTACAMGIRPHTNKRYSRLELAD